MGCGGDDEIGWELRAMGWEATWGGRCGRHGRRGEANARGRQRITHQFFVFLFLGVEIRAESYEFSNNSAPLSGFTKLML
jgi:hypothetical protein